MENRIITVQGNRPGTYKHLYKNYPYYLDKQKSNENRKIYRSAARRNGCQSIIYEYPDGTVKENGIKHMGFEDTGAIERDNLKKELDEAVRRGGTLQNITNTLSSRFFNVKSKKALNMQVRRAKPPLILSQDLKELAKCIKRYEIEDDEILQRVISIDTGTALLFYSKEMIRAIDSESTIAIDRVTNVLPYAIGTEILTIHLVRTKGTLNSTYASFIVYLNGPSQQLYQQVLSCIIDAAPPLKEVITIFTGTDEAMANAILAVFPNGAIKIQWLDYVKEVGTLWKENGLRDGSLQILHFLWILGVCGEDNIQPSLELINGEIQKHILDFPQLGSFFYLFNAKWRERLQSLGSPLVALQLNRRVDSVSRYLSNQFKNCTKNVEKLTGGLYGILRTEKKLMDAFVNNMKNEVRDKTMPCIRWSDVKHFDDVWKQCQTIKIPLESFFITCFFSSLLSKLETLTGIPKTANMTVCDVSNQEGAAESSSNVKRRLNFKSLKRRYDESTVDSTSVPSTSGIGKPQEIFTVPSELELSSDNSFDDENSSDAENSSGEDNDYARTTQLEPDQHHSKSLLSSDNDSDDENCPWEFNGFTFVSKNP